MSIPECHTHLDAGRSNCSEIMTEGQQETLFTYPLPDALLETLVAEATDYALAHGVATRTADGRLVAAPFALLPSPGAWPASARTAH